MTTEYKEYVPPRDFVAYGEETPQDCWPEGKKIVVSFVLNYEEGAEHTLWNDASAPNAHSEQFLNETAYHRPGRPGKRDLYVESMYEYGTRAGLPRLLKLFKEFGWGWSTWTNARVLEASAYYGKYLVEGGHDIACHGNRWITQTELYEEKPQVALITGKPGPEEEAAYVAYLFRHLAISAMDTLKRIDGVLQVKPDKKDETGGTRSRWSNHNLDPAPPYKRIWTMWDLTAFWSSDNFGPGTWTAGSSLIALGWTAREVIPFAFVGALFCAVVAYFNAVAGSRTGCCFPVLIRSAFGPWASLVPVFVRALIGLIWLLVLTFQAADVTSICIAAVVPSYNTAIKNVFPDWIFQTGLNLVPIHYQKYLFNVKGVICPLTFIALLIWAVVITDGGDSPYISGPSQITTMSKGMAALTGINAMASVASTIAVNIPDFSRFQKPTRFAWTQIITMPITATIPIAAGVLTTSAVYTHYGIEGAWEPAALIQNFGSRAIRFFVGASFLLAYVGVNISANFVAFANDFSSIIPRYFNIRRATILAALLCFIAQPWFILRDASAFLAFLGAYGSFLSGVASIMLTDFWIIRRAKVDIREYYTGNRSIYWYWHGINWRACVAWVVSFTPNLPGLASAINPSIPSVNPYTYCVSWFWGTFFAGGLYWLFCTLFPPTDTLVAEAVYNIASIPGLRYSQGDVESEGKVEEEAAYVVPSGEK